jgi:septum formation protein
MISLKVGSLTGLSSKLWPWRSPFAKAGQAKPAPQAASRPAKAGPQIVSRAVRALASPSALRPKLVLASASPRRLQMLEQAGVTPDALRPTTIDESVTKGEVPRHIVKRLARAKAEAAKKLIRGEKEYDKAFVLAADTVVAVGRRVLGKAELEHEAGDALRMLRGRAHRVHTAICLITPEGRIRERVVETRIRFRNLSNEEIGNYLASGEWKGKAGGYAIQGIAGAFVVKLVGSYTNVVGLPLTEVVNLLQGEGYPVSDLWLSKAEVETS